MVYYLSVLDGVRSMRSFIFSGKSVTKIPNLLDWKKLSRRVSYLMLLQWIGLWLWDWAETLLKFYSCSGNLQLYWLVDIGLISYCRSSSSCLRTGHIFEAEEVLKKYWRSIVKKYLINGVYVKEMSYEIYKFKLWRQVLLETVHEIHKDGISLNGWMVNVFHRNWQSFGCHHKVLKLYEI